MSLPISENRTLAAAQRVARADIMSIQDCQIAAYRRGMRRLFYRMIPAISSGTPSTMNWPTNTAGLYIESTAGSRVAALSGPMTVGTRIFNASARVYGGGAAAITIAIYRSSCSAPAPVLLATGSAASSGAWTTISTAAIANPGHTIETGWRYWIRLTSGQSGDRAIWGRFQIDRP